MTSPPKWSSPAPAAPCAPSETSETDEAREAREDSLDPAAKIAALEAEVAALRARIAALEGGAPDAHPATMGEGAPEAAALSEDHRTLRESHHLLHSLIDNSPNFIFVKDVESRYVLVNARLAALFGKPPEAIVGATDAAIFPPELIDSVVAMDREVMAVRRAIIYEEPVVTSEGPLTVVTVKFPIFDLAGKLAGIAGIATDVTAQKLAEEDRAALQQQIIDAQRAALDELSTPLVPIARGVLAMPVVGVIDAIRAQQILEALLDGIGKQRAHTAILDITGVRVVDAHVASALISAARAARLLGARVLLTGIRPEIAQTLVALGTDLAGVVTLATLESGIAYALAR